MQADTRGVYTCCWVVAELLAVCICIGYCTSGVLFLPRLPQRSCRPLVAAFIHPQSASAHLSASKASVSVLVRRRSKKNSLRSAAYLRLGKNATCAILGTCVLRVCCLLTERQLREQQLAVTACTASLPQSTQGPGRGFSN